MGKEYVVERCGQEPTVPMSLEEAIKYLNELVAPWHRSEISPPSCWSGNPTIVVECYDLDEEGNVDSSATFMVYEAE